MRFASSSEGGEGERGVSWKRTDFGVGEAVLRFKKDDDDGLVGRVGVDFAAEKSEAREGSLG